MANPTGFSWQVPTANVDGSPISAGEIVGYKIGVRAVNDATHGPGNYAITAEIDDPNATSEAIASLGTVLAPGDYAAAVETISAHDNGRPDSDFSAEVTFSIAAPVPPAPNPPANFSVA